MSRQNATLRNTSDIDWISVSVYFFLVFCGWMNIYAAVYDAELNQNIFDLNLNSGKQLLWIGTSILLLAFIMLIDTRFFETFAYFIYGAIVFLLIGVLLFGKVVAGSKSWIEIGSFALQPSEFAKFATALAVSSYLSNANVRLDNFRSLGVIAAIILLPAGLILMQNDTGSFLVFSAFLLVLYREGMNPTILILGIACAILFILALMVDKIILFAFFGLVAFLLILMNRTIKRKIKNIMWVVVCYILVVGYVYSIDFFVNNVLQLHQQNRIKALINPDADPLGFGWNVTQSKIAIGSGGFIGKGFLEGTQTKFDFVPEQHTDFIFCTIGEEWGWLGSVLLIATFVFLFVRIIYLAEKQRSKFARIYGYCLLGIMVFHFGINIGMTIGLFPVIGIPLPFFSYGGSSLWSFTILLFIFLNMDANRKQFLG